MTDWPQLERFLRTDPRDVGCHEALALLHVYAELDDDASVRYPGIAAHLRVRTVRHRLRGSARRDFMSSTVSGS
jgi:hypothetical protein